MCNCSPQTFYTRLMPYIEPRTTLLAKIFNFLSRLLLPISFLLLLSCGRIQEEKHQNLLSPDISAALRAKLNLYLTLSSKHQDTHGFVMSDECDSLLFSSLYATANPLVRITDARDVKGAWHRRPQMDCYPAHSPSTISQDMILGLLIYLHKLSDRDYGLAARLTSDLYKYGIKHSFVMGKGDPARTYLRPPLQATLAELLYHLTGYNDVVTRNIPQLWPTKNTDYELHLEILHIYLRGSIQCKIDTQMLKALNNAVARSPENAFFQYVLHKFTDKDQTKAASLLLDQKRFPNTSLPTNRQRDTEYLWQRDPNQDWRPNTEAPLKEYSGSDLIFVANLILEE